MYLTRLFELVFLIAGLVSVLHGVFTMAKWFIDEPASKASAVPEPLPYRVTIEADDGWPLRSYRLPPEAAARLARDLDRDRAP